MKTNKQQAIIFKCFRRRRGSSFLLRANEIKQTPSKISYGKLREKKFDKCVACARALSFHSIFFRLFSHFFQVHLLSLSFLFPFSPCLRTIYLLNRQVPSTIVRFSSIIESFGVRNAFYFLSSFFFFQIQRETFFCLLDSYCGTT